MTWLYDYVLESGGLGSKAGADESNKKDQEEGEETPPPLPPRQRPEVTDEPVVKKSRANSHGMLQTNHKSKHKSKVGCCAVGRGRKMIVQLERAVKLGLYYFALAFTHWLLNILHATINPRSM